MFWRWSAKRPSLSPCQSALNAQRFRAVVCWNLEATSKHIPARHKTPWRRSFRPWRGRYRKSPSESSMEFLVRGAPQCRSRRKSPRANVQTTCADTTVPRVQRQGPLGRPAEPPPVHRAPTAPIQDGSVAGPLLTSSSISRGSGFVSAAAIARLRRHCCHGCRPRRLLPPLLPPPGIARRPRTA